MRCLTLGVRRVAGAPAPKRRLLTGARDDRHPIVDCSVLLNGSSAPDKADTLSQIKTALQQRGYFYAKGVDVLPEGYIASVYDYLSAVHALPIDVKRQFAQGGDRGGSYSGADAGEEYAELDYEAGSTSSVCAWDYSRSGDYAGYPGEELLHDIPLFESFVDELYERQNALGAALMKAFAEMFGLPPDTFLQYFLSGDLGTIRLLNYPEERSSADSNSDSNQELSSFDHGISPHTDFEVFTLMHQDAPGLQLLPPEALASYNNSNELPWVDAPVRPGEFVVIVGDVLERFTNGELKATPHRVLTTPHNRRSIIRFNAVHPDTVIKPLKHFVDEASGRPALYSSVTMRKHMQTTMNNLRLGKGSWDPVRNVSLTATYPY